MVSNTSSVEHYLINGCGRCSLYQTPRCKVNDWRDELIALRKILSDCELEEEIKWSVPTYTLNGANILILSAFRQYASISFFRGVLLSDPEKILQSPGENSQAIRLLKFTDVEQIDRYSDSIKKYVLEAIDIEKSGKKVEFRSSNPEYPAELIARFENDPQLKLAFEALTPGRQRGYILYFNGAKQARTRSSRIEKFTDLIMQGKGMNDDRYKC